MGSGIQKQHVHFYKKILLRKKILSGLLETGAAYVPFCGDGDISEKLYTDRNIIASDIDSTRVLKFKTRIPHSICIVGDSNKYFGGDYQYSIADIDAYNDPWPCIKEFWQNSKKTNSIAIFMTDNLRQDAIRTKKYLGEEISLSEARRIHNFYFYRYVFPRLSEIIRDYQIVKHSFYLRMFMCYSGFICSKKN